MTNFLCLDVNGRTKWPQRTTDHGNETRLGIISQESKTGTRIICLSLHFVSLFTPLLPLFQCSKYVSHMCTKYPVQNTKPFIIELITNKLIACHLHCFIGQDSEYISSETLMYCTNCNKPYVPWKIRNICWFILVDITWIMSINVNVLPKSPTSCNLPSIIINKQPWPAGGLPL